MSLSSKLPNLTKTDGLAVLTGFFVGFLSGLFGIGGGVLLVPAFILFAKLPQRLAHGTSLLPNVFLASSGVLIYILDGSVNWVASPLIFAGSFWGVLLGTKLLSKINLRLLMFVFVLVMLLGAGRLILGSVNVTDGYDFSFLVVLTFVLTGIFVGTLSGLLGIGGGVVMVPVFILLLDFSSVVAKGTSLLVIVPTALIGTYRNYKLENIDFRIGTAAGLGGIPLALVGAWVSSWLSETLGQVLFGILLLLIATRMLQRAFKMTPHEVNPVELAENSTLVENSVVPAENLAKPLKNLPDPIQDPN